ncbi:MAG: hypothetical protein P1Q69_10130 [Candidatus Thorarchaeota archaeon]|nr:hypothetical protein [Candidatus Thorarchaeota archaeon]
MGGDDKLLQMVKDYAPVLRFHPDEGSHCCYPSDAEETFAKFDGKWDTFTKDVSQKELNQHAPCYFEIWKDSDLTQIRYWFWYKYNHFPKAILGIGEHLGDWEHIEVRILSEDERIWLLSNHLTARLAGDPSYLTLPEFKSEPPLLDGNQIHAWVALGSHAHYPSPKSDPYCYKRIFCDQIAPGGRRWDSSANLIDLSETNFFAYTGRWGDSRAPRGPTNEYNNRWRNAPNLRPKEK